MRRYGIQLFKQSNNQVSATPYDVFRLCRINTGHNDRLGSRLLRANYLRTGLRFFPLPAFRLCLLPNSCIGNLIPAPKLPDSHGSGAVILLDLGPINRFFLVGHFRVRTLVRRSKRQDEKKIST